jgi:putative acetyltransferase
MQTAPRNNSDVSEPAKSPAVTIELAAFPNADARTLVAELDNELNAEYPPEQRHGYSIEAIFQPHILFFIARLGHDPVGCGGVAFEHDLGEVKRMYVRPSARGHGVAGAILARLESEARARHIARLTLETGDIRHAAMRLYERHGFRRCGPFGAYLQMPANAIARSVFFEKPL